MSNKLAAALVDEGSGPHALSTLFEPRSVVLYGASERSPWSAFIYKATRACGFTGPMYAVNLRGVEAHGLPGFVSAAAIPERVDAAYIIVPAEGVLGAFEDIGAAGIKAAVLLTSGFAETGEAGLRQQAMLVQVASKYGIRFLGPNSLGFAKFSSGSALISIPPPLPILPGGRVALVSQSGAMGGEIMEFAHQQGVALGFFASTGNEAMLDIGSVIDFLVDDPGSDVIAVFSEAIRHTDRFLQAAARARARRKPIVILKVGASELSAAVAMAHTGSLVGDDKAFGAACLQNGIIRVSSIEELITTAGLLAHTGVLEKPGVAVVSISGGACGLFSDAAERFGVALPVFAEQTVTALSAVQSSYGAILNPFDITGAAVGDPSMFERCLDIIGRDPSVGLTVCSMSMANEPQRVAMSQRMYAPIGKALEALGSRGLLLNSTIRPVNGTARAAMAEANIPAVLGGIENVVQAMSHAVQWSEVVRATPPRPAQPRHYEGKRPVREREVLEYLATFGVPVVPGRIVGTGEEAAAAAREFGDTVALKIASPDIQHKTEAGGVRLGLSGDRAVAEAFDAIIAGVREAAPAAQIDGVIVSPMRERGIELIIGTARDPQWGAMIVVGLGGILVEALRDTAVRLLPVTAAEVIDMLNSLKAVRLLRGFRGAPAADLARVAEVASRVGEAALALGPALVALEINPLRVLGTEVEALDALAVWGV